jgi:hypothetical protein
LLASATAAVLKPLRFSMAIAQARSRSGSVRRLDANKTDLAP